MDGHFRHFIDEYFGVIPCFHRDFWEKLENWPVHPTIFNSSDLDLANFFAKSSKNAQSCSTNHR